MRKCMDNFVNLIKARTPLILVNTYEENAFIKDLCEYACDNKMGIYTWSLGSGMSTYDVLKRKTTNIDQSVSFDRFINIINSQKNVSDNHNRYNNNDDIDDDYDDGSQDKFKSCFFIVKDAHIVLENNTMKIKIKDISVTISDTYVPLILLSPIISIPIELEKSTTIFSYELPTREEIQSHVISAVNAIRNKCEKCNINFDEPSKDTIQAVINSLLGLTYEEAHYILTRSGIEYNNFNLDLISQCKINMVEKSGLLDYIIPKITFEDIGGNEFFKSWINDVSYVLTNEAKEFGCEAPKGYMALGIAGTGKTLIAEAIANKLNVPMFIFNVSKIFNKLVGESEKKIEQTLRIVKSSAPCVLLFDEAEKIFGGYNNSESDGGASSRVFSSILRFLADNDNVFVVMTSNDMKKLPPELTRSGRLDTIWYFGFPSFAERKDIFKIHFNKVNREVNDSILNEAAKKTKNYTGAEIKNIVKQTIWLSYKRYKETNDKEITIEDINSAISKIVPTYKTSKEKINALERYAKSRALFANSENRNIDTNENDDDFASLIKAF